jgi:hypothetical protein
MSERALRPEERAVLERVVDGKLEAHRKTLSPELLARLRDELIESLAQHQGARRLAARLRAREAPEQSGEDGEALARLRGEKGGT